MTDPISLQQLGAVAGLLSLFFAVVFWSVKAQVASIRSTVTRGQDKLEKHLDEKFKEVNDRIDNQAQRLDAHDQQLSAQKYDQLKLRNEMLESMRDKYVRHDDVVDIKRQISALFARLDKVLLPGSDRSTHQ